MSEIYKINLVKNNEVKEIFIFGGPDIENIDEKKYLSTKEISLIDKNNIIKHKIKSFIYKDDTILKVKEKILMECFKPGSRNKYPLSEMYLFSKINKKLDFMVSYNEITENDITELTSTKVNEFLYNIVETGFDSVDSIERKNSFFKNKNNALTLKKEIYNLDDFENLPIWNKKLNITQSISQKLTIKKNYP